MRGTLSMRSAQGQQPLRTKGAPGVPLLLGMRPQRQHSMQIVPVVVAE
jgi:hypothetical protein